MKRALRAILYGKEDLRLEEQILRDGPLEPDEVYVETEVTAMSTGTELGNYLGDSTYVPGAPDYPRTLGYSNVGVIREAGSQAGSLRTEQRVFSQRPHQSAFLARTHELLVPVPYGVSSEQASLAYLIQLGLAALRQARYEPGENVAVVGLGVIGLCTVGLARAMGAKVVGIANSTLRAEVACQVGAHTGLLGSDPDLNQKLKEHFGDVGADIVILTANSWDSYFLSVEIVRFGGRVSILGFPGRAREAPEHNPLAPNWFYAKQLTLLGSGWSPRVDCSAENVRFNLRRNLEYILGLMASGSLALEPLITHRLPYARMREAYELAKEHSKNLIAAVFDWRPATSQ